MGVSSTLREEVSRLAGGVCEYCRAPEHFSSTLFSVEHIVPSSRGGTTSLKNLAFACQGCNNHKYTAVSALDEKTGSEVPLFHPRRDVWSEHFSWSAGRTKLNGRTATGRATIDRLRLNRPNLILLRRLLRRA